MPEESSNHSSTHPGMFGRIGHWFKRRPYSYEVGGDIIEADRNPYNGLEVSGERRNTFLRPWARRDAAISQLQAGFSTLTDLITSVRDNLDKSAARQDELLKYLSHLPEALQSIPEGHRQQSQTLKAIGDQLASQTAQTTKLAEILDRLCGGAADSRQVLDSLQSRVETINRQDESIAEKMRDFGAAMNDVSKNSSASTQALMQMRDNVNARDGSLERILQKQGARFTILLTIAIILSISALAAVGVIGYLLLLKK